MFYVMLRGAVFYQSKELQDAFDYARTFERNRVVGTLGTLSIIWWSRCTAS